MRLIDAEPIENYEGWLDGICLVIPKDLIYQAPTVKTEPVRHGHWIYKELWEDLDNRNFKGYTCSCCNEEYEDYLFDSYELNYCPNCGAKMDGGKDDRTRTID